MTAADLDDAPWTIPAHDGIGHSRIETRKPILVPARRRRRLAANRTQRVRMFIERPQLSGELRCIDFEQLLDLLIGRSAPGRGEAMGIAIGYEEPLPPPEQRRQTQPQPSRGAADRHRSGRGAARPRRRHGRKTMPSRATSVLWPHLLGGGGDFVHDRIIVAGVVMEDDQRLGRGGIGEADALLPSGMAPFHEAREFFIREGRIVDEDIGVADEVDHVAVGLARYVLGVRDVADRATPNSMR